MANVYDDQKTEDLNRLTGINPGEESQMEGRAEHGAKQDLADQEKRYNPDGDSGQSGGDSSKAVGSAGLDRAEHGTGDSGGSLYSAGKDGSPTFRQKLKGGGAKLLKNKLLLGAAGGGGALAVVIVIILVILLGSLKLPNVMSHIVGYEFARLSRQYAQRAEVTSEESLVLKATEGTALDSLKAKYTAGYKNVRESTWGKLDGLRPSKIIENMGETNGLSLNFKTSKLTGHTIFTSATLDGVTYEMTPVTGPIKFVPGLNKLVALKNQAAFAADFKPAFEQAVKANDIGTTIRGGTSSLIRREIGINLIGWHLDKFKDVKTPKAALLEETLQTAEAVDKGVIVPDNTTTSQIKNGVNDAKTAEAATLADPVALQAAINNNGIPVAVDKAITSATESTFATSALEFANPLFAIAMPICIVFDGSVQQSGPAITDQSNQQQSTFYHYASAADQQKAGDQTVADAAPLAAAIGATNEQVGDVTTSNPEILARGGTIDTTNAVTAETGASGTYDYSLLNVLGLAPGSPAAQVANGIATNACAILTDIRVAGGVALVNLAAAIFSFGSSTAGEEVAGQSARVVIQKFVTSTIDKMLGEKVIQKGITTVARGNLNRSLRFAFKQGLVVGGIYGATELANLITANRAAQVSTGLAANKDAINIAQSGANIHAGEIERKQLFGRPLSNAEIAKSDQTDKAYVASLNESGSFSQRYFDNRNANSLVSHVAMSLNVATHANLLTSLVRIASSLLKPLTYIGTMLGLSGIAHATPDPTTQHYGNVQFGWSNAEEQLIKSGSTYTPLENQRILDDSGQEGNIASKYAFCFGYIYDASGNGDFDPTDNAGNMKNDPNSTLGNLLSQAKIERDSNGNVIDSAAQCSPNNLGLSNGEFGTQMVFRWRLAMSYLTTVSQLTNMQDVQAQ